MEHDRTQDDAQINDELSARVINTIAGALRSTDDLKPDMKFETDLNVDSLMKFEVMMAIESEFGLDIHDHDVMQFASIGDVIDYVRIRIAARG